MNELTVIVDGEIIDLEKESDEAYICQQEVKSLYNATNEIFLSLAERFWKIQTRHWFIIYGHETFEEYLQTEAYSRAWVFQLARLHKKYIIDLEVDSKRLVDIGVTKLVDMTSRINADNMDRLLSVADKGTVPDLKREMGMLPEIGESRQSKIDPGYYYLTKAHGDVAQELKPLSKRYVEIMEDESGALIARV